MSFKRQAFTLVELLVVVAIIALLISILLPSLAKARRNSKEIVCGADLRSLVQITVTYAHSNNGKFMDMARDMNTGQTHNQPYWAMGYWREYLAEDYNVQRSMYYSPDNQSWNADDHYYWTNKKPTAKHMVMGRYYFGSTSAVNIQSFANNLLTVSASQKKPPIFPTTMNHKKVVWDYLWTDFARQWPSNLGSKDWYKSSNDRWGANHVYDSDDPEAFHVANVDGSVNRKPGNELQLQIINAGTELYW